MQVDFLEEALGGIGLFLLGVRFLSHGVRSVSNDRIRRVCAAVTSNRITSFCFGALLATAVSSGSAALILTVTLINGGILNAFQAFNVIAGILAGSALVLYLDFVPYSLAASPLILTGILVRQFAHRRRLSNAGDVVLGIGLLFLGLALLSNGFSPDDEHPLYLLLNLPHGVTRLPSALLGALVMFLVQSSQSMLDVAAQLSTHVVLSQRAAVCMVVGGVSGMTLIGLLAALGGNRLAQRVSMTLFCVVLVASLMVLPALSLPDAVFSTLLEAHRLLGSSYSLFCCGLAVLLVASSGLLARMVSGALSPEGMAASQTTAGYLDRRLLSTPILAVEQARRETVRMMSVVSFMFSDVREILFDFDARRADTIRQHESILDSLNHEITTFLAQVSRSASGPCSQSDIPALFQAVSDLEHIGDRCEDLLDITIARKEAGVVFSNDAMEDLKVLIDGVAVAVLLADDCWRNGAISDPGELRDAKRSLREQIAAIRHGHFERMVNGVCQPRAALQFNDLVTALEAIAALCWNIVESNARSINV